MTRAALYARYSTDKQSESSVEDQLRVCHRLSERHGFAVVARFSDAAISGGTTRRPGYQSMLAAARRREFEVIVAEDASRLWRALAEQAPRLAELADLGIAVVTQDLDTRHESAGILGPVSGAMAEQYRREIGRRTRRGLEGLARDGKSAGGRAYGYISATASGTGQREIDPDQARIVGRIFQEYADGASPVSIAAGLNRDGIPSPGSSWARVSRRKAGWLASAIVGDQVRGVGILLNPLYRGTVIWNRCSWKRSASDSHRRRPVVNPRSEWIELQDERLRIVDDALWRRVQARIRRQSEKVGARVKAGLSRRGAAAGREPQHLFSGWLICGLCGSRFTMVNRRSYACASHVNGRACSNTISVRRDVVESRLLAGVRGTLEQPEVVEEFERRVRKALAARASAPRDTKRADILRHEIDNLVQAIAQGGLKNSPALGRRLRELEDELAGLQAATIRTVTPAIARAVPDIRARFSRMLDALPEVLSRDPPRAREWLRQYLSPEIVLRPAAAGSYLEAEYGLEITPLAACAGGVSEIMVAGADFRNSQ